MLIFWVGDDGAVRTKDGDLDELESLDRELTCRQVVREPVVMPACRWASAEFDGEVARDPEYTGVIPRKDINESRKPKTKGFPRFPKIAIHEKVDLSSADHVIGTDSQFWHKAS